MKANAEALNKYAVPVSLALGWCVLFASGLLHYAGSKTFYVGFSLVSLLLLLSAFYRPTSFGYMFVATFLWLGFWFKLTANFLLFGSFPFGEPVGGFDSSPEAWDLVLFVSIAASLGAILGRVLCACVRLQPYQQLQWAQAPHWYAAVRKWLWAGIIVITIAGAVLNVIYGVHQIGVAPRTIFPWPTNALLAWLLNIGAAIAVAVLICWDLTLGRSIGWPAFAILGEAFLTTVSVISRAAFPFHVIPQAIALFQKKALVERYTAKQRLSWLLVFALLFLSSIAAVSLLRDFQYSASKSTPTPSPRAATAAHSIEPAALANPPAKAVSSFRWILIHQLAVNRWIGIEGVMAVSSYAEKSRTMLWEMLTEKREAGKVTAYQAVSNSGYQVPDAKFQFASMPGISGFLYFSGSLWVVFGGMVGIVFFVVSSERIIFRMTGNPILCSLYGITLANTVAQFGMTPRQDIPQFFMIFLAVVTLWGVQTLSATNVIKHSSL